MKPSHMELILETLRFLVLIGEHSNYVRENILDKLKIALEEVKQERQIK